MANQGYDDVFDAGAPGAWRDQKVAVEDPLRAESIPLAPRLQDSRMTCPKCGYEQPQAQECAACGILVGKFKERARVAEEAQILDSYRDRKEQMYANMAEANEDEGFFAPEKKGIEKGMLGGMIMMGLAAVWFFGGMAVGIIFYYPPILFVFGLFAFFKGLLTGNVSGD